MPAFQRRELRRWAWSGGKFAAKIYVRGETFGKLIRRFTQQLMPVSKPRAETEAAVPPVLHKAGLV